VQQFSAVMFVLLALWGAVAFLRKKGLAFSSGSLRPRKQAARIESLEKLRLTPHHSIHLLSVDGNRLLVAVHPQGVTLLRGSVRARAHELADAAVSKL
jgi:flagellar biogenesis protein FliO